MIENANTEQELCATDCPWPKTKEELIEYIDSLLTKKQDYGTCVYMMSLAATAAFHFMAHMVGATGFQASCADLDVIRRTRGIEGPFMLVELEKALYPQYDLHRTLEEFLTKESSQKWLKEQAQKNLTRSPNAHLAVIARWKALAS